MSVFPNGNNPPTGAHRVTQHHPMFGCFIHWKKKETRKWRGRRQTFIAGANACRAIKNLTDQYQMAFEFAETYSRPRFTYMQHLSEILVSRCQSNWFRPRQGQQVAETRQSQRDDGPLFRLFHNQTRDFLSSISRVFFFFFGAGERERMQVWTIVEHSINKRMKREGKWVTSL